MVAHVEQKLNVSQRQACRALAQWRSTQRYAAKQRDDEKSLVARMFELVRAHPRFGYRRIYALLRREGWRVNRKRVYRLWKREGLKVPQRQRKRRRIGTSENSCSRHRPEHKDHVWGWDFVHSRTAAGKPVKWLVVVDEYTRECLALEAARSIPAEEVIDVLIRLFHLRGMPRHIRSDNGPEFIAKAIRQWLARSGVQTLYISPGAPWENAYTESFISRLSDELLDREEFCNLPEAKVLGAAWCSEYNHRRPHSALGYQTPAEFSTRCSGPRAMPGRKDQNKPTDAPTLIAAGT